MIHLKQMGEAKDQKQRPEFCITESCWFRFPWAEMISPNGPLQRKPQGALALWLRGDTIHLPKRQRSLRKDCRCRAVNSVFPQTRGEDNPTVGVAVFCLETHGPQHRTRWSGDIGLPTRGRQSEWTDCLGPGHYSPPTLSCCYKA